MSPGQNAVLRGSPDQVAELRQRRRIWLTSGLEQIKWPAGQLPCWMNLSLGSLTCRSGTYTHSPTHTGHTWTMPIQRPSQIGLFVWFFLVIVHFLTQASQAGPVLLEEGRGPPLSSAAPLSVTFLCSCPMEGQLSKRAIKVPRTILFKF